MPTVRKLPPGVFVAAAAASSASFGAGAAESTERVAGVTPLEEALARSPAIDDEEKGSEGKTTGKRGRGRPRVRAKKSADGKGVDVIEDERPRRGRPKKVEVEDGGGEKKVGRPRARPKEKTSSGAADEECEDRGETERATGSRRRPSRRAAGTPNYSERKKRSVVNLDDEAESFTPTRKQTSPCRSPEIKKRGGKEESKQDSEEVRADEDPVAPKPSLAEVTETPGKEPLPEADIKRLLKKIDSTKARGARWLSALERLRNFRFVAGHCNVPMQYPPDQALANWVGLMRKDHKRGSLDETRAEILGAIGFEWSVAHKTRRELRESIERLPEGMRKVTEHSAANSNRWDEFFGQLEAWKEEKGNTFVPQRPPSGDEQVARLGKWVSRQRVQYGLKLRGMKSDMTEDRIDRLNTLDFSWRRYETQEEGKHHTRLKWSERFSQLKSFRNKYGNFDAADDDDEFPGLKTFIMNQRNACRKFEASFTEEANMTQEKLDELRSIGFTWGALNMRGRSKEYLAELREMNMQSNREVRWEEMFKQFKAYKDEKGDCEFSASESGEDHPHTRLNAWLYTQRRQYEIFRAWSKLTKEERKSTKEKPFITEEMINRLIELGITWDIKRVPKDSDPDNDKEFTTKILVEKRNTSKAWETRFNDLLAFRRENGHCNVKVNLVVNPHPKLSSWCRTQRRQYWLLQKWKQMSKERQRDAEEKNKKPVITEERIVRLEEAGFKWKDPDSQAKSEERRKRKAVEASAEVRLEDSGQPVKKKRKGGYGKPNDEKWGVMFQELIEYKLKHGHCNVKVKNNTEYPVLGTWVKTQRRRYKLISEGKKACLPQHRIDNLDSIGFKWVEVGTHWDQRFLELLEYVAEHGHANVPNTDGPHRKLATWVMTQRRQYKLHREGKSTHMTPERILNLERAGIIWELRSRGGGSKTRKAQHDEVMTPAGAAAQHLALTETEAPPQLPESTVVPTSDIGMAPTDEDKEHDWTAEALVGDWAQQHDTVRAMGTLAFPPVGPAINQQTTGHLHDVTATAFGDGLRAVPIGDEWGPAPLAEIPATPAGAQINENWRTGTAEEQKMNPMHAVACAEVPVTEPRQTQTSRKADVDQKKWPRLVVGPTGSPVAEDMVITGVAEAAWHEKIEALKLFKSRHGDLLIPNKYKEDLSLGRWVKNMRWEWTKLKSGGKTRLTPARIKVLDDLGFAWIVKKGSSHASRKFVDGELIDFWNEKYNDLEKFHAENGHSMVPNRYKSDMSLGAWVKTQRWELKKMKRGEKSSITEEKIKLLDQLDFNWAPLEGELTGQDLWLKRYSELAEYKDKTGNCLVPRKYAENMALGNWVCTQRHQRKLMQHSKKSEMNEERIKLLDSLGFTWSLRERSSNPWEDGLKSLEEFKGNFNHLKVPNNYRGNPVLGRWVKKIRSDKHLEDDKVSILEKIGFEFDASRCEPITERRKTKEEKNKASSSDDRSESGTSEGEKKEGEPEGQQRDAAFVLIPARTCQTTAKSTTMVHYVKLATQFNVGPRRFFWVSWTFRLAKGAGHLGIAWQAAPFKIGGLLGVLDQPGGLRRALALSIQHV